MHPQLKCHTTMTRSALRIHFINLFLSYERQRQIGKRSTKTKAKCECVCVCVSVQTKRQQRERESEKWTENYTEIIATIIFKLNYIQLQIKWNADGAKIATLSFGVMASLPREGQEEQQGGTFRRGSCGKVGVWVSVCGWVRCRLRRRRRCGTAEKATRGRNVKNQLESWPVLPAAVTGAGAEGSAGGGGREQGLSQIISYYPAINLAKCFCCRGLVCRCAPTRSASAWMPHADWLPQRDDVTVATGTQDTPATAAAATVSCCQCASEQANEEGERQLYTPEAEHVASEEVATLVRCSMLHLSVASGIQL